MTDTPVHHPFLPFESSPPDPPPASAAAVSRLLRGGDELNAYDVAFVLGGGTRVARMALRKLVEGGMLALTDAEQGVRIALRVDVRCPIPIEEAAVAAIRASPLGARPWEVVATLERADEVAALRERLRDRRFWRRADDLAPSVNSLSWVGAVSFVILGRLAVAGALVALAYFAGRFAESRSAVCREALRVARERHGTEYDFLLAQDPNVPAWLQRCASSDSSCGGGCGGCGGCGG